MTERRLVLVGGGHAHLSLIRSVADFVGRGHRLTVVAPRYHDYSAMGPGILSAEYPVDAARFDVSRMVRRAGGQFIEDLVVGLEPENRLLHLASGESLPYDVLSINTGSSVVPLPADSLSQLVLYPVKPITNLQRLRQAILEQSFSSRPLRLLVIGGGPAGCEVAGNLQALTARERLRTEIMLVTDEPLLQAFPERTRRLVLHELMRHPLHLLQGSRVEALENRTARLADGRSVPFDVVVQATGIAPSGPFRGSGLPLGPHGGLSVNAALHTAPYPEIFAAGDCLYFQSGPLPKVGVHAIRQVPVLRQNLLAALEAGPLRFYRPQRNYLLIFNLGLGRAVASGYGVAWRGRSARWLKGVLDRRFIRRLRGQARSA